MLDNNNIYKRFKFKIWKDYNNNFKNENISEISSDLNNDKIKDININLINFNNLSIEEIIQLYNKNTKRNKYGDIYNFLTSKNKKNLNWPDKKRDTK